MKRKSPSRSEKPEADGAQSGRVTREVTRMEWRGTGRQGDKETRRQGDGEMGNPRENERFWIQMADGEPFESNARAWRGLKLGSGTRCSTSSKGVFEVEQGCVWGRGSGGSISSKGVFGVE